MQVRLHDHRVQGLVDPAATSQQCLEEGPGTQLGDPQVQVTGRGRQRARPVPVALRGAGVGAFVRMRADHRGQLGLDQRLVDRRRRRADPVSDISLLQCVQHLEQGRLGQGHRVGLLHVELGGYTQRLTRWPLHVTKGTPLTTGPELHHSRGRHRRPGLKRCPLSRSGGGALDERRSRAGAHQSDLGPHQSSPPARVQTLRYTARDVVVDPGDDHRALTHRGRHALH